MSGASIPFVITGLDPVIRTFCATPSAVVLPGVMAGLGPAIHDFASCEVALEVMDTRPKGGHDGWCPVAASRDLVKEPRP